MKTPLSIYIHVPFCAAKCIYCDFLSYAGCDEGKIGAYVAALCNDIASFGQDFDGFCVETVFFGGGTPSLLTIEQFSQILDVLHKNFFMKDAHLSLEANPDTVNTEYLKNLYKIGFRRISFGVQSFDDAHLAAIGRVHDAQSAVNAVKMAHDAGFADINLDLIYSLPHQTLADFEKCLDIALSLPITHVSCYSLTVEDGTPLADEQCLPLQKAMADEEADRVMFDLAVKKLALADFEHYEISNWARRGFCCRHNVGYWTHRQYVGFGLSSASFFGNKRYKKTDDIDAYIDGDFAFVLTEELDAAALATEQKILGLRMMKGIDKSLSCEKIEKFLRQGLLVEKDGKIALSPKGIDLSNMIFSELL